MTNPEFPEGTTYRVSFDIMVDNFGVRFDRVDRESLLLALEKVAGSSLATSTYTLYDYNQGTLVNAVASNLEILPEVEITDDDLGKLLGGTPE